MAKTAKALKTKPIQAEAQAQNTSENDYLSYQEAHEILGVSLVTLFTWKKKGFLKNTMVSANGRNNLISKKDIDKTLLSGKVKPVNPDNIKKMWEFKRLDNTRKPQQKPPAGMSGIAFGKIRSQVTDDPDSIVLNLGKEMVTMLSFYAKVKGKTVESIVSDLVNKEISDLKKVLGSSK